MRFKHLPVHSALDTTKNFEQLQGLFKEDTTVAMAYRSSAQEIVAAKTEQVKVDKVIKQSASLFDTTNGWYVVPFEGYYIVEGQAAFEIGASTGGAFAQINLSGVEKARGTRVNALKETFIYVTVSTIIFCKAGEHIELIASNQTASNCKLEIKESNNQLCVAAAGSTGLTGKEGPAGASGSTVSIKEGAGPFESTKAVSNEPINTELFLTNEVTLSSETLVTIWARLEAAKGTEECRIWLFLDGTAVQTPKGTDYVNGLVTGFAEGVYKYFMITNNNEFQIQGGAAAVPVYANAGAMLMAAGTHKIELRGSGKKGLYKNLKLVVKVG